MALPSVSLDLASDVILRDGTTIRLRPSHADDAVEALRFLEGLSAESLYNRFLMTPRLDLARARACVDVDQLQQVVLVAERAGALVGIAGYHRRPERPEWAEVEFAVANDLQGHGLGTRLLERLGEIARARGLRVFEAFVHGENRRMMDVFVRSGFSEAREIEHGIWHVTLSLEPTARLVAASADRARLAATASLRPFFEPRVVAVVGANREPGRIGSEIFRNLLESGFTGTLIPVNPAAATVAGLPASPRVSAIPGPVDLAVIVVPAAQVAGVVDDCIGKGVKALVVISAGFSECGDGGKALEAELVAKIRAAGVRMIGPNCMGIINTDPAVSLNATFAPARPMSGRLAFLTQSGALGIAILDYVKRLNLGISTFASVGNKADVSGNDLIQYWEEDPQTDVILLYLESFGNPKKFAEIARRISRRKPIVAVKGGRSESGARAASSHTGARATSDRLADAMLRDSGVIRTRTLEELFDVATLLSHQPVPAGRRVAIVTNAGGPAILAADACEANGLLVRPLSAETQGRLRTFLPAAASVTNPVDMIASATPDQFERTLREVAADPEVDSVIAIFIPPVVTKAEEVARAIHAAAEGGTKTIIASFMGSQGVLPMLAPVPSFPFPESAAVALAAVTRYGEWRRRPVEEGVSMSEALRAGVRGHVDRAMDTGGGWLPPEQCDTLLLAAGIPTLPVRLARTADEAVLAANALGFPVVLKASGDTILHKSDSGGVKLSLDCEEDVRHAFVELSVSFGERLASVIVQPLATGGAEMMVGGLNDASFGPVVMAGSGGVLVELMADTAFAMCPVSDAGANALLEQVRGVARLRGFRGSPVLDEKAFRGLIVRVSQLLAACPEIHEMDLNPVMVMASGVVALDARIRLGATAPPPAGRRIRY
jgi:acetyl coenzyme A synthetase (ADP forming)-like protein